MESMLQGELLDRTRYWASHLVLKASSHWSLDPSYVSNVMAKVSFWVAFGMNAPAPPGRARLLVPLRSAEWPPGLTQVHPVCKNFWGQMSAQGGSLYIFPSLLLWHTPFYLPSGIRIKLSNYIKPYISSHKVRKEKKKKKVTVCSTSQQAWQFITEGNRKH